jgi:hypothetical protein
MQCTMLTNAEYCRYLSMFSNFLCFVMILQTKRTKKAGIVGKYGTDTGLSLLIVLRSHVLTFVFWLITLLLLLLCRYQVWCQFT